MKKLVSAILTIAMLACATSALAVSAADPEVPIAKVGDKTLTGLTAHGSWEITDEAATTKEAQSMLVFSNDRMEAGKLTATIDRSREGAQPNTDGIIFCLDEGSNNFWQDGGPTYYFLYIKENKVGLVRTGSTDGQNNLGFNDVGSYTIPEDQRDEKYTISAEWDASGKITGYFEDEQVIEWTDGNPLQGTRYGLRASGVGVAFTSVEAIHGTPSPDRIIPGSADAIPGTIKVDGIIDEAWADATVYTMENIVAVDSTKKDENGNVIGQDSSTVQFRMMYNENKIYMLVEVTDDTWISGYNADDYKNDSLFIYISEDGVNRTLTGETSTQLCAFLENYNVANSAKTGLIVRSGKGANDNPKEHAVKIDGNKAVMELSFQLNTVTPEEGGFFVMDLQYNDQDSEPTGANTRTIVWSWSTSDPKGPNQIKNGRTSWGYVWFAGEPECDHAETELKNAKEATETEDGYTGDKVCKDCGEIVETGKVIPATGNGEEAPKPVDPPKPPKTGDVTLAVSALALVALAGTVVIVRRRKVSE